MNTPTEWQNTTNAPERWPVARSGTRLCGLEDELQRELILARVQRQVRSGDLAEAARSQHGLGSWGTGVDSRQRGAPLGDVEIGLAEVFRVGEVVYLRAELYFHFLANRNV